MASRLVRSTSDQVVRVRALAGVTVLCLHPGVQMGTSKYAGSNPAMDQHPRGSSNTPSRFMLKETGVKHRPHGPLGPVKRLYLALVLVEYWFGFAAKNTSLTQ